MENTNKEVEERGEDGIKERHKRSEGEGETKMVMKGGRAKLLKKCGK